MHHPSGPGRRFALALAVTLTCTTAQADRDGKGEHDYERARAALDRGEVRPMAEILAAVAAQVPGEVVEVEFERQRRGGQVLWVYELKVIDGQGQVLEVLVDAATARVLEVERD